MNRFTARVISLVLVIAVLSLSTVGLTGGKVYAAQANTTKSEYLSYESQSSSSRYDGTYSGTFNYEYREKRSNPDYYNQSSPNYQKKYLYATDWIQASLKVTITFKTNDNTNEQLAQTTGQWMLDITNVIVDDPAFGTGLGGIVPLTMNAEQNVMGSGAHLPYNDTNFIKPFTGDMPNAIWISFPNGACLKIQDSPQNRFKVGFAEWTLSYDNWYAYTFQKGSPLSVEMSLGSASVYSPNTEVNFKDWSLKKVPDQGSVPIVNNDSFNLRLDLSAIYGNVEACQQELKSTRMASLDRIKEIDERLGSIKSGSLSPLELQALEIQKAAALKKANKSLDDAILDLVLNLPGLPPANFTLFGRDIPEIKQKLTSGESLTREDYEKILLASASVLAVVAAIGAAPELGLVSSTTLALIASLSAASAAIEALSANSEVNTLQDPGGFVKPDIEKYRRWLEHQKDSEQATLEHISHEEQRLIELGEYLKK